MLDSDAVNARETKPLPAYCQVLTRNNRVAVVALDHREDTLGKSFNNAGLDSGWAAMARFKVEVTRQFSPVAGGVLLDAVAGAQQAVAEGALADGCSLFVTAEDLGFDLDDSGKRTKKYDSISADLIRQLGGKAMKLLVYARLDRPVALGRQLDLSRELVADCHRLGIPLLLEAQTYQLAEETESDYGLARIHQHHEIAQALASTGADILKLEYPWQTDRELAAARCTQLASSLDVPWAIFSGGVTFEEFASQLRIAMANGCWGFVAGRALWQEAASLDGPDRLDWLANTGRKRLDELIAIAA
jgi:tagatose 1,6-diphosphate aldolase